MRRRDFIKFIAGSAVWPVAANAQPTNKPVIAFLSARSAKESAHLVDAFRKGLAEHGIVEGQNVTIEYSWADSHYEGAGLKDWGRRMSCGPLAQPAAE